jgi:hypothetical protein
MSENNDSRSFWKNILLVIIGALLSGIPLVLNANFEENERVHEFLLDRQIISLRDYSNSLCKVSSILLPKIESLEMRLVTFKKEGKHNSKKRRQFINKFFKDFFVYRDSDQAINSEINSAILLMNTCFEFKLPLRPFIYYDPLEKMNIHKSDPEIIKELLNYTTTLKKNTVEELNIELKILSDQALIIK